MGLDGKTWALAEVTPSSKRAIESLAPPAPEPPLIVTQHSVGPRKFIFLTTQCSHVVTQLRPVDILRQLLFDASGPDSTAVRAFFQVLREDQVCATSLILACSISIQDSADRLGSQVFLPPRWRRQDFFQFVSPYFFSGFTHRSQQSSQFELYTRNLSIPTILFDFHFARLWWIQPQRYFDTTHGS